MVGEGQSIPTPAAYISPPLKKNMAWEVTTLPLVEKVLADFLSKLGREK